MTGFRHLGDTEVHRGHVWTVVVAEFESPDGERFQRDIVRSPGAVAVVPIIEGQDGSAEVVLVNQYRPPYDRYVIEIPAGLRDIPGEPTEQTGRRELIEEAGLEAGAMEHLLDMAPSAGMTDSICAIYLATGCRATERNLQGPEEQHMTVQTVGLGEALAMIERGEIYDAKTVCGLLLADRHLRAASA